MSEKETNDKNKQIEIDEAVIRLAQLLKGSDYTTVQQVLSRVQRLAYPPPTNEQANAQSKVTNACAAQRAVALFRTEARLYSHEAERTARILQKLQQSAQWLENKDFLASVMEPLTKQHQNQVQLAHTAERLAMQKEDEFVRLRREAHIAVAHLMLQEERQYRQEFQDALAYEGGSQAAEQVYKILSAFEQRAANQEIHPRQFVPTGYEPTSPEYLSWLRNKAQEAIGDNHEDSSSSSTATTSSTLWTFTSLLQELAKQCDGVATVAPLKGYERTVQKVQEKYNGDFSKVLDLVRGMLVFDNIPDLLRALQVLKQYDDSGKLRVMRAKDRLSTHYDANQFAGGYRDVLLNVVMLTSNDDSDGNADCTNTDAPIMVTELQLHLDSFLKIKNDRGHVNYEAARNIHMFNYAFTSRTFLWEPDTDEEEIRELLSDIQGGVITNLSLDYSNGLWSHEAKERLKGAFQDSRCALRDISLRSCRCGDDFILMNVNEEYIATLPKDLPPIVSTIRLGSLIHEGTAGRITQNGIAALLGYFNDSLRVLDLEGCLDLEWFEACGDDIVEAFVSHVDDTLAMGRHALSQFQELNLKSTGLTEKGAELLDSLRDSGKVPHFAVLHDDDLTKPPRAVGPHRRPAVKKEYSAFLRSSQIDEC